MKLEDIKVGMQLNTNLIVTVKDIIKISDDKYNIIVSTGTTLHSILPENLHKIGGE